MLIKNKKGFTVIELLVVVTIVGLLASTAVVSLNNSRKRSRDMKRLNDMNSLRKALEAARTDGISWPQIYIYTNSSSFNFLVPNYINSVPIETHPASTNVADWYFYCNVNTQGTGNLCHNDTDPATYAIRFKMETDSSLGVAGYYCLTSQGIFPREYGDLGLKCLQR